MHLVLDITTSAEFWRRIYPGNRAPKATFAAPPESCATTLEEIAPLIPPWMTDEFLQPIGGRVHVLSLGSTTLRGSKSHTVHIWSSAVPEGSFYYLKDNVCVLAPSFMFLMAATLLNDVQLIAFGCELCGLYGFDESDKRGFRKRTVPLLTVEHLQRYLSGAKGCRGYRKAIAALPHVVDNSASPMETFDAMALCLPYRLGGYGLEKPLMNCEVPLSSRAARIAKRRKCYLDMGYTEKGLDVEHQGKLDHSSLEDQASDRARVNALKEMGYEVIELTKDQVDDLYAFEFIVQRIAGILGKRIRKENLGATAARLSFRRDVTAWNHSSGRLRLPL